MLQRAASNAYSWWMASHIRTKQSKWMEQNLADMEEKVSAVIKLLSEEGDSFMQKAEMYYKKRPELIHFVEEFFRGYRALADRYDHLSTELQNANNTIAQVCPDQVRGMEDDDDDSSPRFRKKPTHYVGKVPNVPKLPVKELKFITSAKKKVKDSKVAAATATASKSGLTKDEGVGEIGRIQKLILALQTEKEFVKSSYETGLAKYRDVENKIKAMQEKVDTLQDEFGEGKVIDDEEARILMATTALKSCKNTLDQLQETRDRAVTEAEVERTRIKGSRGKLDSLKKMFLPNESIADEPIIRSTKSEPKASHIVEKIKDDIESEVGDDESMMDMAEKINVLVNKVTSLETAVASQTALIQRIRLENDELEAQIQNLEDCKADEKHDLKMKITEMELKLQGIQDLEHSLEDRNKNIQSHSNEAQSNLDKLSQKVKPVVELESPKTFSVLPKNEPKKVAKKVAKKAGREFLAPKVASSPPDQVESIKGPQEQVLTDVTNESKEVNEGGETGGSHEISAGETGGSHEISAGETGGSHESSAGETGGSHESSAGETGGSHESSEVSEKGEGLKAVANVVGQASSVIANTESRDHEYAAELSQNLEETKKKLMELEANHQNDLFEMTLQLKELKNSNTKKDEEIRSLRLKLSRTHCINQKDDNNEESDESKESCEKSGHLLAQEGEDEEETIPMAVKESETASAVEKQFRTNIDELLEENLDFWFRFSSTLYEIQRFKTGVKDLEGEVLKLDERQNQEGSSSSKYSIKSDVRPLYKHLKEMQTDLSAWIEKSASLKEELKNRSASLSEIQEEITKALKASAEDEEFSFTSYQAAKFQGEILNMKQENNRVADELQAGLDLARTLQRDAETSITKLSDDWGLSGSKSRHGTNSSMNSNSGSSSSSSIQGGAHSNVPLRSFIFGAKPKKKNSIFSSVVQQRKHKSGF